MIRPTAPIAIKATPSVTSGRSLRPLRWIRTDPNPSRNVYSTDWRRIAKPRARVRGRCPCPSWASPTGPSFPPSAMLGRRRPQNKYTCFRAGYCLPTWLTGGTRPKMAGPRRGGLWRLGLDRRPCCNWQPRRALRPLTRAGRLLGRLAPQLATAPCPPPAAHTGSRGEIVGEPAAARRIRLAPYLIAGCWGAPIRRSCRAPAMRRRAAEVRPAASRLRPPLRPPTRPAMWSEC